MSRTDEELVRDALEHLDVLSQHLMLGSIEEPLISDAVCMRLSSAIESISQSSNSFREKYFTENWHLMKATRNLISHGYLFVDQEIIRLTIEEDVPQFESILRKALTEF